MSDQRFDVTFIRGPRDVSPWKQASRQIFMRTNNPQSEPHALHALQSYEEKKHNGQPERFPNAIFQQKGRN